jgi:outer membrane protein OmpA-like peptidoglycan-associated protein
MKMKKSIIITGALLFSLSSFAQEEATAAAAEWKNNFYLSVGGGTQVLFSSDASNLGFKQRFTPAFFLSGGKWISPFVGVRLQVGGYSLNGYSTSEGIYLGDPLTGGGIYGTNDPVRSEVTIRPDGSYRHYLRYVNAHADIQASLFNLFGEHGKWDVMPAVGIGYLRTLEYKGTPATNNLTTHFSLAGKYSLTREWDINAEASVMVLPGSFDGRITQKTYESAAAITVGVTYNFGNRPSRLLPYGYYNPIKAKKAKYSDSADGAGYNQILDKVSGIDTKVDAVDGRVGSVEGRVGSVEGRVGNVEGRVGNVEGRVSSVEKKRVKREPFVLTSIRFELNKADPARDQDIAFVNIANYLRDNPQAKMRLEGYGDKETGSSETNLRVAGERVEVVRRLLQEKYNVNPQQIETKAIGDATQPYPNNSWNRVVIVVATD